MIADAGDKPTYPQANVALATVWHPPNTTQLTTMNKLARGSSGRVVRLATADLLTNVWLAPGSCYDYDHHHDDDHSGA